VRRVWLACALGALGALAAAAAPAQTPRAGAGAGAGPAPTLPPASSPADAPAELNCLIQPKALVSVASPIEGVLEAVEVDRGDVVAQGQVVARLEASVERAAVEAARARAEALAGQRRGEVRLGFAERSLERQAELQRKEAVSLQVLDEAETEKQLAEVELEDAVETIRVARQDLLQAEAVLERRTIKSPVDGVVVRRILSPGEYADPPQVLEVAEIDPLYVEAFVPVDLLGLIEIGDRGLVVPEGRGLAPTEAAVTVVDPVVDAASGTFGVRLELPNPDHAIPAGLRCRVRFDASTARTARGAEAPAYEAASDPTPDGRP
jgi:RND family efflux transporter MFP subunit